MKVRERQRKTKSEKETESERVRERGEFENENERVCLFLHVCVCVYITNSALFCVNIWTNVKADIPFNSNSRRSNFYRFQLFSIEYTVIEN